MPVQLTNLVGVETRHALSQQAGDGNGKRPRHAGTTNALARCRALVYRASVFLVKKLRAGGS